jgi:hypothetical protein
MKATQKVAERREWDFEGVTSAQYLSAKSRGENATTNALTHHFTVYLAHLTLARRANVRRL